MTIEETPLRIARLRLRPSDVLLVKCRGCAPLEQIERVKAIVAAAFPPGARFLVFDESIDLAVASPVAPRDCGRPG